MSKNDDWFEDPDKEEGELQIDEYDLTSTPNDFNVVTIYNFMKSGVVKIPTIQRNFVWDIKKASKLIESLILGLPVPQIFLYEESRNIFSVIDGQQRLMSIYYFIEQRFPRDERRVDLRKIFDQYGYIPEEILNDDEYFIDFKLNLPLAVPGGYNKFHGLKYSTLGEFKRTFELRPIRNVIVKQNSPKDDNSSIFEIFNRLNTGGVNLKPQEIRASMYDSKFYRMLYRMNENPLWRKILGTPNLDKYSKDVELLLRYFAFLIDSENYNPPLTKFLNNFSRKCKNNTDEQNKYLNDLFDSFLNLFKDVEENPFINKYTNKFVVLLFEAVFVVTCEEPFKRRELVKPSYSIEMIRRLSDDPTFNEISQGGTTKTTNVSKRIERARQILFPHQS